jgi:spoIIIJ-associated protein
MANFFSKLFGKSKALNSSNPEGALTETIEGVIDRSGFDLTYEVKKTENGFLINLAGSDSGLCTDREGLLIDSFQIFLKRMLQNKFSDQKIEVEVDCSGFLESSAQELRDVAEKLKNNVLEKGQAAFMRALPPRDRKVVHRYLAEEGKVRSQSVGEGFLKKIKITIPKVASFEHGNAEIDDKSF